jgi:menaquinone-dependent protoporphyrinogen oxidase
VPREASPSESPASSRPRVSTSHWSPSKGSTSPTAATFVRRHEATLAGHPVWFFSSGPVGTETITKAGKDILAASEPKEFGEFAQAIPARDQHVFFGAYDPDLKPGSFLERLSNLIPAVKEALPVGDFRDWPAIEAWAHGIAEQLEVDREAGLVPSR